MDLHEALPYHDGQYRNWGKERTASTPYRYDDGVTIWVANYDVDPDDKFLTPEEVDDGDTP